MNSSFKKGILICRNIFHGYLSFLEHLVRLERGCLINYWIGKFELLLLNKVSHSLLIKNGYPWDKIAKTLINFLHCGKVDMSRDGQCYSFFSIHFSKQGSGRTKGGFGHSFCQKFWQSLCAERLYFSRILLFLQTPFTYYITRIQNNADLFPVET